jgi:hypothetical protein
MFHASESTGLLDCCGKFWLRPERLLRGLVRRHSPDRVVSGYGRDDDVAHENLPIARVATVFSLLRWPSSTHEPFPDPWSVYGRARRHRVDVPDVKTGPTDVALHPAALIRDRGSLGAALRAPQWFTGLDLGTGNPTTLLESTRVGHCRSVSGRLVAIC